MLGGTSKPRLFLALPVMLLMLIVGSLILRPATLFSSNKWRVLEFWYGSHWDGACTCGMVRELSTIAQWAEPGSLQIDYSMEAVTPEEAEAIKAELLKKAKGENDGQA